MKISELPTEIREVALTHQRNAGAKWHKKTRTSLDEAFNWNDKPDEFDYWRRLHEQTPPLKN